MMSWYVVHQWRHDLSGEGSMIVYLNLFSMTLENGERVVLSCVLLLMDSVKLGYNAHDYNEFTVITNEFNFTYLVLIKSFST